MGNWISGFLAGIIFIILVNMFVFACMTPAEHNRVLGVYRVYPDVSRFLEDY